MLKKDKTSTAVGAPVEPDLWPSVDATWQVMGPSGAPQLQLSFAFQPQRYQDRHGINKAKTNESVYAQLAALKGIAFSIETSIKEAPIAIEGASLTKLTAWLSTIQSYLRAVAGGASPRVPANPLLLSFPLTGLTSAQLFKLTCSFVITCSGAVVEGNSAPDIAVSKTPLSPIGAATDTGLMAFAQNFETGLTEKASMVKVMVGRDRFQGGTTSSSALWALRIGLTPGQPVSYNTVTDKGAPIVFAPAPLSTSLVSAANIPIFDYVSGKGINFAVHSNMSFANIDLDQWVREIFAAVDTLLSPKSIAPLAVLDEKMGTTTLAALQSHRTQLAVLYAQQMAPVFVDQSGTSTAVVKEIFCQHLLEQLSEAYRAHAVLQFSANVAASIVGEPAFTLAFLVATADGGGSSASCVTVDLDDTRANVEHRIETVLGTNGYLASSWLQFVLRPASGQTGRIARALGSVVVPLVLRAYPASPAMVLQTGRETNLAATNIKEAAEWTYSFTYSLPFHSPQDSVHVSVSFNGAQNQNRKLPTHMLPIFPWIAEFVTVYPAVENDLVGALATITAETSDRAVLTTAQAAITTVDAILAKIVGSATLPAVEANRFEAHCAPQGHQEVTGDYWAFSLVEASSTAMILGRKNVLLITVTVASGNVPQVQIASYTMVPYESKTLPPNRYQYYFLDDKKEPLDFSTAQKIAGRMIVFPGLDIRDHQTAWTTAHVTRNEHLVTDTARKTNTAFVYRTPDASFADALIPIIETPGKIDIAMIGSADNQPVTRSLSAHLTALFQSLVTNASPSTMIVQQVVTYQYAINPPAGVASVPVTVPVMMGPPLAVTFRGQPPDKGVSLEGMIAEITKAITSWFTAKLPSLAGGMLQLSVTIFATPTMPLLHLTNLELKLQYVQPPLAGATEN